MEKGMSAATEFVMNYIHNERNNIDFYVKKCLEQQYCEFTSEYQVEETLSLMLNNFLEQLNDEEKKQIRTYTGYQFKNINAILRNNWNYEVNGTLTLELQEEYLLLADAIRKIIYKAPFIPFDLKVYRGVSISAFRDYHITKLEDLIYLKNHYLFEDGFTSTSFIKEKCFYNKDIYTITGKPNILIEYLIPKGSDDGVPLLTEDISYSKELDEFLINSSSLFQVIDVQINEERQVAYLKVLLIPERIWNYQDYQKERETELRR